MKEYATQGREKKKEKKKERKKERKEGKKEGKKRKKKGRGRMADRGLAGGRQSWPEKMAKTPNPRNLEGAILVKNGDLEF